LLAITAFPWLGPIFRPRDNVTPLSIRYLILWNNATRTAKTRCTRADLKSSPFDPAETKITTSAGVRVGGIAHQNWNRNLHVLDELLTGEIIRVWATGLGAVSPEVAEGSTAPTAEPFARLASPLTCSNAESYVERVYHVDLLIGEQTGNQQLRCSITSQDFPLLTTVVRP